MSSVRLDPDRPAAAPTRRRTLRPALLGLCLPWLLAGCGGAGLGDPYARQGSWKPEHVNDANLRAMVADPADLLVGRAGAGASGQTAAVAVARLRADRVKKLPDTGIAQISVVGFGASAAAPAVAP